MATLTLSLLNGKKYTINAMSLDRAIHAYLPNSVNGLRAIACQRTGMDEWVFSDLHDVTSFLFILAKQDESDAGSELASEAPRAGQLTS